MAKSKKSLLHKKRICEHWSEYAGKLKGVKVARRGAIRTIVGTYSDIPGGVILDDMIEGFRSWNIMDLTFV